jgi:hypothetical protein
MDPAHSEHGSLAGGAIEKVVCFVYYPSYHFTFLSHPSRALQVYFEQLLFTHLHPHAFVDMAPSAIYETPNVNENFNSHKDGLALEATSDAVDEVNVLKAAMRVKNGTATQEEIDIYEQSKFDAEKDKTQFRQYEQACDRVKAFYREQHEKQTVAYNLKASSPGSNHTITCANC